MSDILAKICADKREHIARCKQQHPLGELEAAALELAEAIAANGPVAVRAAKVAIDKGCGAPLDEGLSIEAQCYERVLPTEDRLEALAAFAEKRKPRFEGR